MKAKLTSYHQAIIDLLNCTADEARKVETIMRDIILNSTLDWLSKREFNRCAREAHQLLPHISHLLRY